MGLRSAATGRWRRTLKSGRFASSNELAAAEKINSSYVSRLLRLTLLAPEIVEAILDGRQLEGAALPALMEPFPVEWQQQLEPERYSSQTSFQLGG